MTTPAPAPAPAAAPGKTLGIVGLILAFLAPLIGLILSLVARSQSKKAGVQNTPATVGIIIGIIGTIIILIAVIVSVVSGAALLAQCAELGPGTYGSLTCG
jgi:DMSO/TMAO reductase YedYZ heme-binding membrane subunit